MKNILYINPIFDGIEIITFVDNFANYQVLELPFLEFAEKFPKEIISIFQKNHFDEIWCISGPWAFTQMRIISLTLNAIKFSSPNIILKSTSYFDICRSSVEVLSILEANANEFLIRKPNGEEIFIKKSEIGEEKYHGFIGKNSIFPANFDKFMSKFDNVRHIFDIISPVDFITPLYLKPPHITWAK